MLLLFEEAFEIIVKTIEGSLWKGDCMMLWKVEQSFEEKTSVSEVECVWGTSVQAECQRVRTHFKRRA